MSTSTESQPWLTDMIAVKNAEISRLRGLLREAHTLDHKSLFPMACKGCDWFWARPIGTRTADCWEQGKALHAAHVRSLTGETE